MRDRRTTIAAAGLTALCALCAGVVGAGWRTTRPVDTTVLLSATGGLPSLRPATELLPALRSRVAERPRSADAHRMLAVVLGRSVGETGDESVLAEAEWAARRAVELRPDDADAAVELARALARQHAFDEAMQVAEGVMDRWPERADALAVIVDGGLGLGRYDVASAAQARLRSLASGPAILAREAALAELHGRDHEALGHLVRAATGARERYEARTSVAWYQFRVADFLRRRGEPAAAIRHADAALRLAPGHLGAQRVRAAALVALGRLDEGIVATEALAERLPHPEIHAGLGDLYALAGRRGAAARSWQEALRVGDAAGEAEDRPMARLLADHGWRPAEAVARARRDLRARQDLEGWDTLAWALYRSGELDEAADASARALRLGTRRADFEFHAGMIHAARGDWAKARRHLERALAIDARFDPRLGAVALDQLASLDGRDRAASASATSSSPEPLARQTTSR